MKVGDLLDTLAGINAACPDVDPPMTDEEWRDLDIVVRGMDDDGNDFCGALVDIGIEVACGDGGEFLAFDASNAPEAPPRKFRPLWRGTSETPEGG